MGNQRLWGGKATGRFAAGVEKIVIPEGYESIGDHAFDGCTALRKVILPTSLKKIGYKAFRDCSSLRELYIYSPDFDFWPVYYVPRNCAIYVPRDSRRGDLRFKSLEDRLAELAAQGLTLEDDF